MRRSLFVPLDKRDAVMLLMSFCPLYEQAAAEKVMTLLCFDELYTCLSVSYRFHIGRLPEVLWSLSQCVFHAFYILADVRRAVTAVPRKYLYNR